MAYGKLTQISASYPELGYTSSSKSTDSKISLSYGLTLAGTLGALGRRFDPIASTNKNHAKERVPQTFFTIASCLKLRKEF